MRKWTEIYWKKKQGNEEMGLYSEIMSAGGNEPFFKIKKGKNDTIAEKAEEMETKRRPSSSYIGGGSVTVSRRGRIHQPNLSGGVGRKSERYERHSVGNL